MSIFFKSLLTTTILYLILCGTGIMSSYIGDVDISVIEFIILYVMCHVFWQLGEPKIRHHRQEVKLYEKCNDTIERINNIINQHNCNKVTATYVNKYFEAFDEVYTYFEIRCITENINFEIVYSEEIQLSEKTSTQEIEFIKEKVMEKFPNRFIERESRKGEEFLLLTAGLSKIYKQKYDREDQERLRKIEEEQRKQYIRERKNIPL